jgi:short-subunit dehydrogenase
MDMAACREMFETNFFGAIKGMQAAIPVMVRQGSGTVINISSVAGHIPLPMGAAYSATKFAMNAIGKAARMELVGTGVHVLTVCPGFVKTNFPANVVCGRSELRLNNPIQGITAERVAQSVLLGYLKNKREVVVPGHDRIFIKLYQLWPWGVEYFLSRMVKRSKRSVLEEG